MLRTSLLNGTMMNYDVDLSKYVQTFSKQAGVIDGLEVENNVVKAGSAWVKVNRRNGDEFFVLVTNEEDYPIQPSGDVSVRIEVKQEIIDNGMRGNPDGTDIAEIKLGDSVPAVNSLLLARIAGRVVSDARSLIPNVQDIQAIASNSANDIANLQTFIQEDRGTLTESIYPLGENVQQWDVLVFNNEQTALIKSTSSIISPIRIATQDGQQGQIIPVCLWWIAKGFHWLEQGGLYMPSAGGLLTSWDGDLRKTIVGIALDTTRMRIGKQTIVNGIDQSLRLHYNQTINHNTTNTVQWIVPYTGIYFVNIQNHNETSWGTFDGNVTMEVMKNSVIIGKYSTNNSLSPQFIRTFFAKKWEILDIKYASKLYRGYASLQLKWDILTL